MTPVGESRYWSRKSHTILRRYGSLQVTFGEERGQLGLEVGKDIQTVKVRAAQKMGFILHRGAATRRAGRQGRLLELMLLSLERQKVIDPFNKDEAEGGQEIREA